VMRPKGTAATPEGEALLTRPVVLLALIAFAALFGFQLLLSVVPLYADDAGGGPSGAGFATAAFMLSTVFAQAQMPRILDRFGYRLVLAVGLLFLGLPAFVYTAAQTLVAILAVTLLRGVGFGVATVVFAALMVELAPPGRRGEALGLLGIVIALPAIFCTALGLWLAERFGYGTVFLLGAVAPLLGIAAIFGLRSGPMPGRGGTERTTGFFAGLGRGPPSARLPNLRRHDHGRGDDSNLPTPGCRLGNGGVLRNRGAPRRGDRLRRRSVVGGALRRSPQPTLPTPAGTTRRRSRDGRPPVRGRVAGRRGSALWGRFRVAPERNPGIDDEACLGDRIRVG
jgi:MFS family permease